MKKLAILMLGLVAFVVTPAQTISSIAVAPASVVGGTSATGTVNLSADAPSAGYVVTLSSTNSAASTPASVTVKSGQKSATFTVKSSPVASNATATIKGVHGSSGASEMLSVLAPTAKSVTISPSSVTGGSNATGTATLDGQAPAAGVKVTLTSSSADAKTPSTVSVSAGSSSATFTVTTSPVTAKVEATISATANSVKATGMLTVTTPTVVSVALTPTFVVGGGVSTGTVTLSGPAASTVTVALKSSATFATVPTSVSVASGAKSATFTVKSTPVATTGNATISATADSSSATATLRVKAPSVLSVTLNPTTVLGGATSTGTVSISGSAPAGGFKVSLASNQSFAKVSSPVTIAAGALNATFPVTTTTVSTQGSASISASAGGTTGSATLSVYPSTIVISMTGNHTFSPSTATVLPGMTVQWQNTDWVNHTVMSDTNVSGLDSDSQYPNGLPGSATFSWKVPATAKAGTNYYYHCRFHGSAGNGSHVGTGMAGTITVQ